MNRRYCFFNVDGLLNKSSDWKKPFTINYGLVNFFCHFLSQNNLIPILTSSWRIGFNGPGDENNAPYIKELEEIFDRHNLKKCYLTVLKKYGKKTAEDLFRNNACFLVYGK